MPPRNAWPDDPVLLRASIRAFGKPMEPTDGYPRRYRVREFPDEAATDARNATVQRFGRSDCGNKLGKGDEM
jgi:hypothetical protein